MFNKIVQKYVVLLSTLQIACSICTCNMLSQWAEHWCSARIGSMSWDNF